MNMLEYFFQSLGFIGAIIGLSAYVPQMIHLLKTKDSTGVSILSWSIWLFGALLLIIYAVYIRDIVFMMLTIVEALALLMGIILSSIYKKKTD